MIAFVDESFKRFGSTASNHYALAAFVVPEDRQCDVRTSLLASRLRGQIEIHWRDENRERQHFLIEQLLRLKMDITYVCRVADAREKQERSRRMCMQTLLMELGAMGVTQVIADGRQRRQDAQDVELVRQLRDKGWVRSDLRLTHQSSRDEALLWGADIACGALSDDADGRWHLERLRSRENAAVRMVRS